MARNASILATVAVSALVGLGCASEIIPPPVLSDAQLGRVIIYRNGVAYFERYGAPDEESLTMRVPAERVDDFLKSLTIVDEKSGEAMPAAFPTVDASGDDVEMSIKLPKGHGRLRISYVTESPAWKPSYRLVLGDGGKSRLQAWAVVDNVSGEDWTQVKIGVGSTSALSFRYDLHSVRLVERETLSTDQLLALAPPTGGSPYASGGKKLEVVGNLSAADIAEIAADQRQRQTVATTTAEPGPTFGARGMEDAGGSYWRDEAGYYRPAAKDAKNKPTAQPVGSAYGGGGLGLTGTGMGGAGRASGYGSPARTAPKPDARPRPSEPPPPPVEKAVSAVRSLAGQIRSSNQRVRVEGFAQEGDKDLRQASLDRANALREQLIAEGVPPTNVEAIGTGRLSGSDAVRIVEAEEETTEGKEGARPAAAPIEGQPLGSSHFVSEQPMTIARDHSAMVSILNTETDAKRIYFYDPVSSRGSKKFAFNAVRLTNPSGYTLDSGPFTVYEGNQFLGEGLAEPILPHGVAFVPYALDRSILVEPEETTREEIDRLLTIQRGIVTTETQRIRRTKLTLTNRGTAPAEVYVRHQVQAGFELRDSKKAMEKLGGAHLFPVTVPAGQAVDLEIEEATPIRKTIDIRTADGIGAIELYLKKSKADPELEGKLRDIVKTYSAIADLDERMVVLADQMNVYRSRVDELNVQLVTLKKVAQAQKLSRHLSDKMQEISEKLQQTTIQMSDLKGQQMALRIELQDKLAELTLRPAKTDAGHAGGASGKVGPGAASGAP